MNYIYCYTNKINGHQYVGQTNNVERRKREHRSCANNIESKQQNISNKKPVTTISGQAESRAPIDTALETDIGTLEIM